MPDQPLVSIIIYNYNYGRFLRECIQSALDQTYENIEILMSDNASDDDSWEIFVEFERANRGKFFIARNRQNYGTDHNFANCWINKRGIYHLVLGSDDVLEQNFVERAVNIMEQRANIGFVMAHRSIIDSDGEMADELPFYDRNCVIHPPGQSIVYMMAAVNPTISQIIYRSALVEGRSGTGDLAGKYYATRILDFNISLEFPIAYIKDPLIRHRIHGNNQNLVAADDLMEALGFYVLNIQFADRAREKGFPQLHENFPRSVDKVSDLCLRYALRGLVAGDYDLGKKYYHLAHAFRLDHSDNKFAQDLAEIFSNLDLPETKERIKSAAIQEGRMTRMVSYEPPQPYVEID